MAARITSSVGYLHYGPYKYPIKNEKKKDEPRGFPIKIRNTVVSTRTNRNQKTKKKRKRKSKPFLWEIVSDLDLGRLKVYFWKV